MERQFMDPFYRRFAGHLLSAIFARMAQGRDDWHRTRTCGGGFSGNSIQRRVSVFSGKAMGFFANFVATL